MPRGYEEGPVAEEAERRRDELERGVEERPAEQRLAVYGATEDNPERHFVGWADAIDADELFASGSAWGITVVRRAAHPPPNS